MTSATLALVAKVNQRLPPEWTFFGRNEPTIDATVFELRHNTLNISVQSRVHRSFLAVSSVPHSVLVQDVALGLLRSAMDCLTYERDALVAAEKALS